MNTSASSMLSDETIRCAVATIPEVRQYAEYDGLTVESAMVIVNDAVSTGHILRTNGEKVTAFPSYYGLRFIATADEDRGFYHASNSRNLRAACLKLYTAGVGKKDADPNATTKPRAKRAEKVEGQTKIFIEVQDSWDAMMDDASTQILAFIQKRNADKIAAASSVVDTMLAGMNADQQAAFFAAVAAAQIAARG